MRHSLSCCCACAISGCRRCASLSCVLADEPRTVSRTLLLLLLLQHGGKLPSTSAEKDAFKGVVKGLMARVPMARNLEQALSHAYRAYVPYELPSSVRSTRGRRSSPVLPAHPRTLSRRFATRLPMSAAAT